MLGSVARDRLRVLAPHRGARWPHRLHDLRLDRSGRADRNRSRAPLIDLAGAGADARATASLARTPARRVGETARAMPRRRAVGRSASPPSWIRREWRAPEDR